MKVDEKLVRRACCGDENAAAELIRLVWPDAYRIARSLLSDPSTAQDVAQEACARAWQRLTRLRHPERFSVWFYQIVVNESRRIIQCVRRDSLAVVSSQGEIAIDERIAVRTAIDALEPRLRLPIVLRYYYGLRAGETARVLGVSAVTIRWRLMLAHRRLGAALTERDSHAHSKASSDGRFTDESIAAT